MTIAAQGDDEVLDHSEKTAPVEGGDRAKSGNAARVAETVKLSRHSPLPGGSSSTTEREQKAPTQLADPVYACRRYFEAIEVRDLDSVLDLMTPLYSAQLRDMRRFPDFEAFFRLWCEAQGQLKRVLLSQTDGDIATVLLDASTAAVCLTLQRIDGRWLIDSERADRRR